MMSNHNLLQGVDTMALPMPDAGEEESEFIARFLDDEDVKAVFADELQRRALARGQWKKSRSQDGGEPFTPVAIKADGEESGRMHFPADVQLFLGGGKNADRRRR
jgi:hypothetical protein